MVKASGAIFTFVCCLTHSSTLKLEATYFSETSCWRKKSSSFDVTWSNWIGVWMGPRIGLDDVEGRQILRLAGLEIRTLGRPACRQSIHRLHWLHYPAAIIYRRKRNLEHKPFVVWVLVYRCRNWGTTCVLWRLVPNIHVTIKVFFGWGSTSSILLKVAGKKIGNKY
jgi:hypothetical protein